jgi:hypothetical protein
LNKPRPPLLFTVFAKKPGRWEGPGEVQEA